MGSICTPVEHHGNYYPNKGNHHHTSIYVLIKTILHGVLLRQSTIITIIALPLLRGIIITTITIIIIIMATLILHTKDIDLHCMVWRWISLNV